MKQGALILNRAGELIWLDFADVSAKLLMNRAVAFESFRDWENEIGRVTFMPIRPCGTSLKKADLH